MSHKPSDAKPKRAAAYARRSVARQMAVIRKYAKQNGLEIWKRYSDGGNGGKS